MKPSILLIDDDKNFTRSMEVLLKTDYEFSSARTQSKGLKKVNEINPDVVLLDLILENGENGIEILQQIKKIDKNLPVIMITGHSSVETAVKAIRMGAVDYISKAPNLGELDLVIKKSLKERVQKIQHDELQNQVASPYYNLVGESEIMEQVKEKIQLVANNLSTVLITGESGVGKEIVARQIHLHRDNNDDTPFIPLNCAAIPAHLLESELFGHEKGAFTGADKRKIGKFEVASDGIIFFDEISELHLDSQVKLLRVIQEKVFERVGGNTPITTEAKIIAATNQDLETMVKNGKFRQDLFYRLNVFPINVPPLRKRKSDIPLLTKYFINKSCDEFKCSIKKELAPESLDLLQNYSWPGNVRELRNIISRAVILSRDSKIIQPKHLDANLTSSSSFDNSIDKIPETWSEMDKIRKDSAKNAKRKVEKKFIKKLLKKFDGNITKAAEHAGINRTNFHKMMKRCGL
ncbi:MAG TPA: sigma-54 dependent transcriptional regulator [bacterium]|nr:sigma-54 dependent transcriptional regulator [bacterium]